MSTSNSEVATTPVYGENQLAEIKSFDDAIQTLTDAGISITDVSEYGDGFEVMDKAQLVNVPFVIMDYKFADGDYPGEDNQFAIVRVMTRDNRKGIITDGSTGIRAQIRGLQRKRVVGGVMCKRGLTVSEYEYTDPATGEKSKARTFYLGM